MCAFETWEISEHSAFIMTFVVVGERTTLFYALLTFLINSAISIIKKARRAKKEVGKRSKSKQPDKTEVENGKPGTRNLNKWPLRRLIRRTNHYCQSIIPINTNSGFRPWHCFASVSAEVRRSEDSMPKKPWKESFLALFYEEFPVKISFSRAFRVLNSLISQSSWSFALNPTGGLQNRYFTIFQSPLFPWSFSC